MKHWEQRFATYVHTPITTYATSRSTFTTSIQNTCNIPLKHLKHLKYTLATCVSAQIYLQLGRFEAHRRGGHGARCRGEARSAGGEGGQCGEEHRGGRMARERGMMAGGGAGAWWGERTAVGPARWRASWRHGRAGARAWWRAPRWRGRAGAMWLCGHDGGTVNGEERRRAHEQIRLGERIRKWRVRPLG